MRFVGAGVFRDRRKEFFSSAPTVPEHHDEAGTDPSHVILDLKVPRFSGLEVQSWIRSHPVIVGMPAIILTSSQVPSDIQKATALGVDAFLVKPVLFRNLVEVVTGIAERWRIPTGLAQKPSL